MPDITLCSGEGCGIKDTCVRWEGNTPPNAYRQSYFLKPPFKAKMDGTDCEHYNSNRRYELDG